MPSTADRSGLCLRLEGDIRILTEQLGPRDRAHPDVLRRAADHIHNEFLKSTPAVSRQSFSAGGSSFDNVLARFGPEMGELVVIGAHYDSVSNSPGADDNASGVAAVLELARRLSTVRLATSVELGAYALEESLHAMNEMGSRYHAEALRRERASVQVMISLEMIGFYSDAPGSQSAPDPSIAARYPSQGNFLMVVGRPEDSAWVERVSDGMKAATSLPIQAIAAARYVPGIDLSDHRNFWDCGYPAVMITDTAFYRNPHYHRSTDKLETLDMNRLSLAVDAITAAVFDIAG